MSNKDIAITISAEDKTSAVVAEVVRNMDRLSASSATTGRQMATFSASAAQTANAMRMLPMQFTDIVTQLSAGTNPLQVLIQQGGQIKDSFGGVGPAMRAVGSYVAGLINPLTVAGGAVAALGVAWKQGAYELDDYKKKLTMTGNAAAATAGSISAMAREVAAATGATRGASTEILTSLAGSGYVSADLAQGFANTASLIERNGGQSAEETAKDIVALGQAPLETLDKLEKKYHFVTAAVYAQVKALEEQGRVSDAARVAQEALVGALDSRLPALQANLGTLEGLWRTLKDGAKGAWDAMLDIGRESSLEDRLAEAEKSVRVYSKMGFTGGGVFGSSLFSAPAAKEEADALRQQIEIAGRLKLSDADRQLVRERELAWTKEKAKYQTEEEKRLEKIARVRAMGAAAGAPQAEIDKAVASLNKDDGSGKARLGLDLERLRSELAEMTNIYANAEKIVQAQRSANLIDEASYWRAKEGFILGNAQIRERELQAELERLQRENLSGKDKIENDKKILETESKLAALRSKTSSDLAVNSIQEQAALDKKAQAYRDATEAAREYISTIERQYAAEVGGMGQGDKFRFEQSGRNRIEDKYMSRKYDLDRDLRNDKISREYYDQYLEIARSTRDQELVLWEERNAAIDRMNSSWVTGASESLRNYSDAAANVARQTEDAFTSAFLGLEDVFANFVKTGKLDFKSLADSIIADIVRIQVRSAMSEVTKGMGGWFKGLFGGGAADSSGVDFGGLEAHAKGGVHTSASLSAYSGSIVDRPTIFAFARGAGLMGEAGPEAILPLRRGPDGRLGVSADGSGGAPVIVNVINNAGGTQATQRTRNEGGKTIVDVMIETVKGAIASDIASGGPVAGAIEGQYGLNRAAGAWGGG